MSLITRSWVDGGVQRPVASYTGSYDRSSPHDLRDPTHTCSSLFWLSPFTVRASTRPLPSHAFHWPNVLPGIGFGSDRLLSQHKVLVLQSLSAGRIVRSHIMAAPNVRSSTHKLDLLLPILLFTMPALFFCNDPLRDRTLPHSRRARYLSSLDGALRGAFRFPRACVA